MSNRILVFYGSYRSDRMGSGLPSTWSSGCGAGVTTSS